jgi:Uma2 family endonuclease
MTTIAEVQYALRQLDLEERRFIASWLEGYEDEEKEFIGVREPALKYAEEPLYMTEEEYLEFEERNPKRHEYVNGYVHAMSAPSMAHGRIVSRLIVALGKRLGGGPCEAFSAGLKLSADTASNSNNNYFYPDVAVRCDRAGWEEKWLLDPRLIVEVLSPSTQHIDRREKATAYRIIPSMEEYVIAAQSSCQLTIFRRAENWVAEVISGTEAVAEFRSLGVSIPLAEIYEGVVPGSASARNVSPG